ncbi:MAG: hypothetical protein ACHQQQ_11315 [Bacteroidota bacterium]
MIIFIMMKRWYAIVFRYGIFALFLFPAANACAADSTVVQGKITYIAGDAIYTSLGNKTGVGDSTILYVLVLKDTVGLLKVYATSSQSSVARILQTKRSLKIDMQVTASVQIPQPETKTTETALKKDTLSAPSVTGNLGASSNKKSTRPGESGLKLQGRVGLQYYTNVVSGFQPVYTQPGIVFNVRGTIANSPIRFETYGNIRSLISGTHDPFSPNNTPQTRIYRMSVQYDDNAYLGALGRIIPVYAPTIGYIDGGMFMKKSGNLGLGVAAGYEPSFTQRMVSTTMKKFAVFGMFQSNDGMMKYLALAYARTFYYSQIDREVVSSSVSAMLDPQLYFSAQGDLDLRSKANTNFILAPRLTNFYSNLNYRMSNSISVGLGYSGYRSTYSFSSIQSLPDSFIDNTIRNTLNLTAQIYLPGNISIYHGYSPRSSDASFGTEYLDNSTLSFNNVLNTGFIVRTMLNLNSTILTTTHGVGANIQKSFGSILDMNIRYQRYKHFTKQFGDELATDSYAMDLMSTISGRLNAWTSIERLIGGGNNSFNIFSELSWSF